MGRQAKPNRKKHQKVTEGIVHIKVTFNNTLITVTDSAGNVLCQSSAGAAGFKGARKSTPYAAQMATEEAVRKARELFDMRRVVVRVTGPGAGRESAIRAVNNGGLDVLRLIDATPLPHNGCRARKKRRV